MTFKHPCIANQVSQKVLFHFGDNFNLADFSCSNSLYKTIVLILSIFKMSSFHMLIPFCSEGESALVLGMHGFWVSYTFISYIKSFLVDSVICVKMN